MIDKKTIKAIGFDVDGTLYKHSTESSIAIGQAPVQKAVALLGRGDDDIVQEF